jgi:hypothetical protein
MATSKRYRQAQSLALKLPTAEKEQLADFLIDELRYQPILRAARETQPNPSINPEPPAKLFGYGTNSATRAHAGEAPYLRFAGTAVALLVLLFLVRSSGFDCARRAEPYVSAAAIEEQQP